MELAAAQGFEVHVVALPPGLDPADLADGFEQRLGSAETYLGYRVRLEIDGAADRQEAFVRVRDVLARFEDSPQRQDAIRYAADKLDLPKETQAGLAPRVAALSIGQVSPRLLDAGARLERDALAGVTAHRSLVPILAELGPEHFDSDEHRRLRDELVDGRPGDPELDARAAAEGIDERTAEELLLRLRERRIRRELADADPARTLELQATLAKIRDAVEQLASAQVDFALSSRSRRSQKQWLPSSPMRDESEVWQALLRRKGLSVTDLAARLGVTRQHAHRLLTGRRPAETLREELEAGLALGTPAGERPLYAVAELDESGELELVPAGEGATTLRRPGAGDACRHGALREIRVHLHRAGLARLRLGEARRVSRGLGG